MVHAVILVKTGIRSVSVFLDARFCMKVHGAWSMEFSECAFSCFVVIARDHDR
jgi:hypothetical protein